MDTAQKLERLLEVCEALDITVRIESLGGEGGGLCLLKGQRVLFVDADADGAWQMDTTLSALAHLPELDRVFLPPALRQAIEARRAADATPP